MPLLRIKELREEKALYQKQLGDILGVNQQTVSSWECGAREPDIETIKKLCKIFEVSSDYLLGIED